MAIDLGTLPPTATPADYLRLQFDAFNVPPKRIVGLLACQRDPLLKSLTTRIHAVRPAAIAAVPIQKGKGQKKKDKSADASGTATPASSGAGTNGTQTPTAGQEAGRLWEVELEDTVIFPEGGGQPSDTGNLTFTDPNGDAHSFKVEMCIRRKLESIHLVRVAQADEGFFEALQAGDEVHVNVDWERRVDQMTIHTAQHLLSAVLDTRALPTLSWAMHAHPSLEHPYVELQRQLTWQEAEQVEEECNRLIDEAKKIWIEVSIQGKSGIENGDGKGADVGDDGRHPIEPEDGERESRGLPKDYAGGVIRHCCIDATDRNACCGTQLPHLGLISQLHVLPPALAAYSSAPSQSATKLYFTAGPRARRCLASASREMSRAAQALGSGRDNLAERAQRAEELKRQGVIDGEGLRKELAKVLGEKELRAAIELRESRADGESKDGAVVVYVDRTETTTHDFDFLGMLATSVQIASDSQTTPSAFAPLTICMSAPSATPGGLLLVQSKDDALAKSTKERISAALNAVPVSGSGPGESGAATPVQSQGNGDTAAAKPVKVAPRVKGGGAKGRYMCKIEGKVGKREREAVGAVVDEIRAEVSN